MAAVPGSIEHIESPSSLRAQKREWTIERIGWGVCAAILVAANDILEAARRQEGIEHFDQIKFAVLERSGEITVVPAAK